MKRRDDGFIFACHTGYHLEKHFAGEFFGVVHIAAAESDLPYLGVQRGKFERSHISVSDRFADGINNAFAGFGKVFFRKFGAGFFGQQIDKCFRIILDKGLQQFLGQFIFLGGNFDFFPRGRIFPDNCAAVEK